MGRIVRTRFENFGLAGAALAVFGAGRLLGPGSLVMPRGGLKRHRGGGKHAGRRQWHRDHDGQRTGLGGEARPAAS